MLLPKSRSSDVMVVSFVEYIAVAFAGQVHPTRTSSSISSKTFQRNGVSNRLRVLLHNKPKGIWRLKMPTRRSTTHCNWALITPRLSTKRSLSLRIVYKFVLTFKSFIKRFGEFQILSPSHACHLNMRSINHNKSRTGVQNKTIIMKKKV